MKKFIVVFLFLFSAIPASTWAQGTESYRARITDVQQKKEVSFNNNEQQTTQTVLEYMLKIISGSKKGEIITVQEQLTTAFDDSFNQKFQKGDVVLLVKEESGLAQNEYYILDHARTNWIYVLVFLFAGTLIMVGRWKGLRALLGLVISFFVILKFIVPRIMDGANPLFVSIVGAIIILLFLIYLTEGLNKKSTLAVLAISLTLFLTAFLSYLFTTLTKLSGTAQEETIFLVQLSEATMDFRGLLLAGILIGTLGILDDIVISQIASIKELIGANPKLSRKELLKGAQRIGISHVSSMANTLFLAYAGVSLPLIMLFSLGLPPFDTTTLLLNSEIISTEIIRTLVGSIGLVLAVPITNLVAVYFLKK